MANNTIRIGNVEILSLSDGLLEFDLSDFFRRSRRNSGNRMKRTSLRNIMCASTSPRSWCGRMVGPF